MFDCGSLYDLEEYGVCKCTNATYYDNMRLYEMQKIDDGDYIIINEYGELYGEGGFDEWDIV